MGVESANYLLLPKDDGSAVSNVLTALGAERREVSKGSSFDAWVLRGDGYWIDVIVGPLGPNRREAISLRIALSNPQSAAVVLRHLMAELLRVAPGELADLQTRRTHSGLGEDEWREIYAAFVLKRDEFQRHFGPFEAAISGDDVFDALHAQRSGASSS